MCRPRECIRNTRNHRTGSWHVHKNCKFPTRKIPPPKPSSVLLVKQGKEAEVFASQSANRYYSKTFLRVLPWPPVALAVLGTSYLCAEGQIPEYHVPMLSVCLHACPPISPSTRSTSVCSRFRITRLSLTGLRAAVCPSSIRIARDASNESNTMVNWVG